jgi:hypothetical protein
MEEGLLMTTTLRRPKRRAGLILMAMGLTLIATPARAQDEPAAVRTKVRFMTLTTGSWARGLAGRFQVVDPDGGPGAWVLDAAEVQALAGAVQADTRSNLIQLPIVSTRPSEGFVLTIPGTMTVRGPVAQVVPLDGGDLPTALAAAPLPPQGSMALVVASLAAGSRPGACRLTVQARGIGLDSRQVDFPSQGAGLPGPGHHLDPSRPRRLVVPTLAPGGGLLLWLDRNDVVSPPPAGPVVLALLSQAQTRVQNAFQGPPRRITMERFVLLSPEPIASSRP